MPFDPPKKKKKKYTDLPKGGGRGKTYAAGSPQDIETRKRTSLPTSPTEERVKKIGGKYIVETARGAQELSQEQWDRLREAKKGGGTPGADIRDIHAKQLDVREAQKLKALEPEQRRAIMEKQQQERLEEEMTPKPELQQFVEPRLTEDIDIRDVPMAGKAGGRGLSPVERAAAHLFGEEKGERVSERVYEISQAALSPLMKTPYVKDVTGIFNYRNWRSFGNAEQSGKEATAEFDSIIWDVMRGAETPAGSQMRWTRAEDMLDDAADTIHGHSMEDPVFFRARGEDVLYEYEQIRRGLNNKAHIMNSLLSVPPGNGRMAIAKQLGVWPEELPGGTIE